MSPGRLAGGVLHSLPAGREAKPRAARFGRLLAATALERRSWTLMRGRLLRTQPSPLPVLDFTCYCPLVAPSHHKSKREGEGGRLLPPLPATTPALPGKADIPRARGGRDACGRRDGPTRNPAGRDRSPGSGPRLAALPTPLTAERREEDPPLPRPRSPRQTKSTDFTSPAAIFSRGRPARHAGRGPSRLSRRLRLALRHRPLQPAAVFA